MKTSRRITGNNSEHTVTCEAGYSVYNPSLPCSTLWVSYALGNVLLRTQPKGWKPKMMNVLIKSGVNLKGALKQKKKNNNKNERGTTCIVQ